MSIRMEVNAARIKKGVPRKARRRGEKPPPARRSRAHGRFPPSSRKILLSAQKNFRELKNNSRASKTTLLRQRPQFARKRSCRKGEGGARFIMVCPQMRTAEENSEQKTRYLPIARFGWGFPKITAIRSRRRGENCVNRVPSVPSPFRYRGRRRRCPGGSAPWCRGRAR